MTKLIVFTGKAGVGKDTAANYLAAEYDMDRYAFADPIKDALEAMGFPREEYDVDGVKDEIIPELGVSYRKLAQTLGTEWGRSIHPDFWVIIAKRFLRLAREACSEGFIISDGRFENETAWVRSDPNGQVIHIDGPARRALAVDGQSHASEAGVERRLGDITVNNTAGLGFLRQQLDSIIADMDDREDEAAA